MMIIEKDRIIRMMKKNGNVKNRIKWKKILWINNNMIKGKYKMKKSIDNIKILIKIIKILRKIIKINKIVIKINNNHCHN